MNTPDEQHHIMVDLETLGTEPGSVIVTLAAVQFGGQPGRILNTFIRHRSEEHTSELQSQR